MSTARKSYETSWISDPKRFYRKVEQLSNLVPPPPEPFVLVAVKVGQPCMVRGPPTLSGYDRWARGTVLNISSYTFPDGAQSDRFVVEFADPAHPLLVKHTGVFFKRWYEICGVGEERLMPPVAKAVAFDMLRTRVVFTPFLARAHFAYPDTWLGPVWTPGFIENHSTVDGKTHFDLKFPHFMGGMTAPVPTRVAVARALRAFMADSEAPPPFHTTMHFACAKGSRVGTVDDESVRRTAHKWGGPLGGEEPPKLWCECLRAGTKVCEKAGE